MLRLRELRLESEKTQGEMAKIFGVSRQVYANHENEINQPSLEMLVKMADFFECSVDYLLGRSDDFGNISVQTAGAQLTTDELQLIEDYRDLTPALQKMLRATIETWKGSDANESKKRRDIQPRRA